MKIKKKKKTFFSIMVSLALFVAVRMATVEVMHLIPDYVLSTQLNPTTALGETLTSNPSATATPQDEHFKNGVLAYQAKRYSQAVQLFQSSLQSHPNPHTEFYLGMAYTHQQQYPAARTAFEQVMRQVPSQDALALKTQNNLLYLDQQQAEHQALLTSQ